MADAWFYRVGTAAATLYFFYAYLICFSQSANFSTTWSPDTTWNSSDEQTLSEGMEEVNNDQEDVQQDFVRRLEREAQTVSAQHLAQSPDIFLALGPPQVHNSPGFMHGYVTNTGAGNRQVSRISEVVDTALMYGTPEGVLSWDAVRFNHSQYLLATTMTGCALWTLESGLDGPLFTPLAMLPATDGSVVRCQFQSLSREEKDSLTFGLLTRNPSGLTMNLYEVIDGHTQHVISRSSGSAPHLNFLNTGNRLLLVSVVDGQFEWTFQKTSKFRSDQLDISYPGLVSQASFVVDGQGYVAVANHTNLLLLQHDDYDHLEVFESLYLEEIVSVTTFWSQSSRYLLVSSRNVQRLYLWHPDGLIFRQQLLVTRVDHGYVVNREHCQQDIFLVLTGEDLPLRVFLWDGNQFDQENGVAVSYFRPDPQSLCFLDDNQELTILAVEKGHSRSIAVKTTKSQVLDPVVDEGLRMTSEMNRIEADLRGQEFRSQTIWQVLNKAVVKGDDLPLTFETKQAVASLKVSQEVTSDFLMSDLQHLSWEGSPQTKDDLQWTLDQLELMVKLLEDKMDSIEKQLEDVVLSNESTHITGHKTVLGSIRAPSAVVSQLSMVEAGHRNLDQVMQNLYRLNDSLVISGRKTIKGSMKIAENADFSRVNDVSFNTDILLTSKPQHITGHWTFITPLLVDGDVVMDGQLNGIKVSDELVNVRIPTFVHNTKTFQDDVHVKEALVAPRLDGVQMDKLFLNSLTRTQSQVIHVLPPVLLEHVSSRITGLTVNGLINGLDVGFVAQSLARTDKPLQFTGRKTFLDASLDGGIVVHGKYDGVHLPFDLFGHSDNRQITGTKRFERLRVTNAVVNGLIDGMKLERDVLTLTGDQEIFEKIFSSGITVQGDILVAGRIDGVSVDDLNLISTEPWNGTNANVVFMQPVLVEKNLVINKVVGVDLEAIESDLVFPDDKEVIFTGEKHFSDVMAPRIQLLGRVNGYDIRNDFVTIATDQIVKGRKTFIRPVLFGSSVQAGHVDGVDLLGLNQDHISLSSATRVFQGPLTFVRHMRVEGDLEVMGSVNGMDLSRSLLLSDSPSFHLSNKIFQGGLTVSGQIVLQDGQLIVAHLDGVDVGHFIDRRVTLSTDQKLDRSLVLAGSHLDSVSAQLVNQVDIIGFASDVMTLSTAQLVTGHKSFTGPVIISGNVKVLDTVNGYDIHQLSSLAVRLDRPLKFDHHVTLDESLLVSGDLTVRGRINGVDLDRLASRSLRRTSPLHLTGNNTFSNGIEIRGNVVARTVNDRRLDRDLLLNHGDQTVTGTHTFSTVRTGVMSLKGLLNEVDIVKLNSQTAKTVGPTHFLSDLDLPGDLVIREGTRVLGLINGLSLEKLHEDAVWKESPEQQVIAGRKSFSTSASVATNAQLQKINGVDFTELLQDIVYVDLPQVVLSEKRFESGLDARTRLQVLGKTEVKGQIDGVQLEWLTDNAVFVDKPATITGDVHVLNDGVMDVLSTTGRVNEIVIQKQVLLLNTDAPQTLRGRKTFSDVRSEVNLEVTGTVNGFRLPDLFQDTLLVHSSQALLGTKTFTSEITVVRPHYGLINQIDISSESYALSDDIEFQNNVIFDRDVILQREATVIGLINDLDLSALQEQALSKTGDQVVLPAFVLSEVSASNVLVEGHISGIDVDRLHKEVQDYHFGQGQVVDHLRSKVTQLDTQVNALTTVATESVVELDGLILWQQLNVSGWVLDSSSDQVRFVDPLHPSTLHRWFWKEGRLHPSTVDIQQEQINFIFLSGSDGISVPSSVVSLANKYHWAQVTLDGTTVEAKVDIDQIIFTRSMDSTKQEISLPYPGAKGVRLFSSAGSIQVLVLTSLHVSCQSGTVHLLVWPVHEPEPILVRSFSGGDLDFGVFELEGLQYLLLAGTNEGLRGHYIKVYQRGWDCPDQRFKPMSLTPFPNLVSLDLFSLDGLVHLVAANRTTVQIFRFAGLQGFQPLVTVRVRHALNVQTVLAHGDLYFLVGQPSGIAYNLLYKATWNGSILRSRHFIKWL